MGMRQVILHYHLFKNAGTSVDRALKEAFGQSWKGIEARHGWMTSEELANHIMANPRVEVFSSHTVVFPLPDIAGVQILPILFLRDPIDRAKSVYEFEVRQKADTDGAVAAKQMTFPEYVSWRMGREGDYQFNNFQTVRCSPVAPIHATLSSALNHLNTLPFVGVVEAFDRSIALLSDVLTKCFPLARLKVHRANASRDIHKPLTERIGEIKSELGSELYERLAAANAADIALHRHFHSRYETESGLENHIEV